MLSLIDYRLPAVYFESLKVCLFYLSIEIAASKCADDRLKPFNGTCYLFVSYPEVDWFTAQQVCAGIHGELASINTAEEQRYIYKLSIELLNWHFTTGLTTKVKMIECSKNCLISDSLPQIYETNWIIHRKPFIGWAENLNQIKILSGMMVQTLHLR